MRSYMLLFYVVVDLQLYLYMIYLRNCRVPKVALHPGPSCPDLLSRYPWCWEPLCSINSSELNFHIWNANSQLFAQAKGEAKMAVLRGKFWTSVLVIEL